MDHWIIGLLALWEGRAPSIQQSNSPSIHQSKGPEIHQSKKIALDFFQNSIMLAGRQDLFMSDGLPAASGSCLKLESMFDNGMYSPNG